MSINIFDILNGKPTKNFLIPDRDSNAVTGSQFIAANMNVSLTVRESNVLNEFLAGNIPEFLRKFTPVTIEEKNNKITYLVMADGLSIGSNSDYVRMPMDPITAQKIADKYDCTLPTRKMVNDIWEASVNKLNPLPWGPPYDASMMSTYRVDVQNKKINKQLIGKNFEELTSGCKKDIVLTNRLYPNNPNKRVAIFGWIQSNGQPIQGLNPKDHEINFKDYSHQARMIANDVILNGKIVRIQDIFNNKILCYLLSDEGPLLFQRY